MERFNNFLGGIFSNYAHIILAGDFNLPQISWKSPETTTGVSENTCIELLHDYFLVQLNNTATRGDNILDLVITIFLIWLRYAMSGHLQKQRSSLTIMSSTSNSYSIPNVHSRYRELCTIIVVATSLLCDQLWNLQNSLKWSLQTVTSTTIGEIEKILSSIAIRCHITSHLRRCVVEIMCHGWTAPYSTISKRKVL